MFKFPINLLKPIEDYLKHQKADTEKKMAQISVEDPFNDTDRLIDNASIDTEVKEQEGHERVEAIKLELSKNLVRIRKALTKIKIGKYGICERCGKMIDTDRLAVMPAAELCLECEKKKEK
ncbi:MAG: TraR/DksA C4-type zinc finger protein [Candidatus Gottesmanbacteria bacterium]